MGDYYILEVSMPAPWAAGAQVRIIGSLHGQQTINVLNFATNTVVNDDPTGTALLKALANAVKECVEEFFLPAVTQDWTFDRCDARLLFPVPMDPVDSDAPVAVVGELSPTSVSFVTTVVHIRTGGGGRSGRGRMSLPPAGEGETQNSLLNGPTLQLLAAFLACVAAKFIGAAPTEPWRLGVLSRKKVNNVLPPFDDRFREATQLLTRKEPGSMNTRKLGVGA